MVLGLVYGSAYFFLTNTYISICFAFKSAGGHLVGHMSETFVLAQTVDKDTVSGVIQANRKPQLVKTIKTLR